MFLICRRSHHKLGIPKDVFAQVFPNQRYDGTLIKNDSDET